MTLTKSKSEALKNRWVAHYAARRVGHPSEYVVRIFLGRFPRLALNQGAYSGKRICDVGCGDGRNLRLFHELGLRLYATEIDGRIVTKVKKGLADLGVAADIRTGFNHQLPFKDSYFDYLTSWHVAHYANSIGDFHLYAREYARTLVSGGTLVLAVPKKTNYVYENSRFLAKGYCLIQKNPYQVQNGQIMRRFRNETDLKAEFAPYFKKFRFGSVEDDAFGVAWHYHMMVAVKK